MPIIPELFSSGVPSVILNSLMREWEKGRTYCLASDRRLRLFACACCRLAGEAGEVVDHYEEHGAPLDLDSDTTPSDLAWAMDWARNWSGFHTYRSNAILPDQAQKVNILSDLLAHFADKIEFNYVSTDGTLSVWQEPLDPIFLKIIEESNGKIVCPWVDDTVRTLAKVAYDNLHQTKCVECLGYGYTGRDRITCDWCRGSRVDRRVGTMDNVNLLAVADAMLENGMPLEVRQKCLRCNGTGGVVGLGGVYDFRTCDECDGRKHTVGMHRLQMHLRSGLWHYRGCWAIDAIFGRL